jgi:hypothetical protein
MAKLAPGHHKSRTILRPLTSTIPASRLSERAAFVRGAARSHMVDELHMCAGVGAEIALLQDKFFVAAFRLITQLLRENFHLQGKNAIGHSPSTSQHLAASPSAFMHALCVCGISDVSETFSGVGSKLLTANIAPSYAVRE